MRNGVVAALLVVVVALGAGAGYLVGASTQVARTASTTTVTTTLLQPCAGQVVWDVNSSSSLVPVLLMQPNSTAYACVTYQTWWKGNASEITNSSLSQFTGLWRFYPFTVSNYVCTTQGQAGYVSCGPDVSNAFRTSIFPSSVQITEYTNYVTVLYTVTALSNSTGYYSNSVPYEYCTSMPMAVGHPASEVNGSDFGPLMSNFACPFVALSPVSVSVSGIGVVYLKPW
jgi:hypothetical protein